MYKHWLSKGIHILWKLKYKCVTVLGGKTVGARALIIRDNEILLVKHTYLSGWYTIGGAVELGETPKEAIIRELKEEVGVVVLEAPELFGIYYTQNEGREDYVIMYILKNFIFTEVNCPEIAEKQWFSLSNLPTDVSPATLRRVEEYIGKRVQTEHW